MSNYCYFNLGLSAEAAHAYLSAMMKVRDVKGKTLYSKWSAMQEVRKIAIELKKAGKNPVKESEAIRQSVKAKFPALDAADIDAAVRNLADSYREPESLIAPPDVFKAASQNVPIEVNPLNKHLQYLDDRLGHSIGKERDKQHKVLNVLAMLPAEIVRSHFSDKLKEHGAADIFLVSIGEVDKKGNPVTKPEKNKVTGEVTEKPVTSLACLHYSGIDREGLTQVTMLNDEILGATLTNLAKDVVEELKKLKPTFQAALDNVCEEFKVVSKATSAVTAPQLGIQTIQNGFALKISGVISVKGAHHV